MCQLPHFTLTSTSPSTPLKKKFFDYYQPPFWVSCSFVRGEEEEEEDEFILCKTFQGRMVQLGAV